MTLDELFALPQYSLPQAEKDRLLLPLFHELTEHHRRNCPEYARLLHALGPFNGEIPYIPVGLFKSHRLSSIPRDQVFKTLTSSGTTGQQVSQVVVDRETARRQTIALSRILQHVLGPDRLPMLLIDNVAQAVRLPTEKISARGAGVLGLMNFGRNHVYALDDEMNLNEPAIRAFLEKYAGRPFLIFGFTFMVWRYFFERIAGLGLDLSNGILIHSGGWKKLQDRAVDNTEFKARFREATGLARIYNFYGMVEQVGSVYLEGEDGFLYAPNFAEVIVRDPETWREAKLGSPGVIQVLSILPLSYPGHSILTEDIGVVHAIDAGSGGRLGKAFSVIGRVPRAELRGCSDTHQERVA
jgi:Acyl-protein synthetase, LuxE